MKKFLLCLCAVTILFLFTDGSDVKTFADEQGEFYSFYAENEDEALRVAGQLRGELLGFRNGIAEIYVPKDVASEIENSIESGEEQPVELYPDITYSMDLEAFEGEYELWYLDAVNASSAWELSKGSGVKVAVIDSGIDLEHPDLSSGIVSATTTIPSTAYGTGGFFKAEYEGPQDYSSHGTHVAGIIGARQNDIGITGIAPECSIISVKVTDNNGSTSQGRTAWVAAGVREAVALGAQIINISLGGSVTNDVVLKNEIDAAVDAGVTVVVAACNTSGVSTTMYPAAYDNVITVSALRKSGDTLAFASSYSNHGPFVNISAPGSNIMSTVPGGYGIKDGTSMAAPMVSGAIAVLLSEDPSLSISDIKDLLYTSAKDLGPVGYDTKYGHGALDVGKLLSPYSGSISIGNVYTEIPSGKYVTSGQKIKLSHDTVGGKILYTIDGNDVSDDPLVYSDYVLLSGTGDITLKAMVLGKNGDHGEMSEFFYHLLPEVTEIDEGSLEDERIADFASEDPVMELPCRRYHIAVPSGKMLRVKTVKHTGNVITYLLNREDENGTAVGNYENGAWILKNNDLSDKDIWISVLDNDGENMNDVCTYDLQVSIADIPTEPERDPDPDIEEDDYQSSKDSADSHIDKAELLKMIEEYEKSKEASYDGNDDDSREEVNLAVGSEVSQDTSPDTDWVYVQSAKISQTLINNDMSDTVPNDNIDSNTDNLKKVIPEAEKPGNKGERVPDEDDMKTVSYENDSVTSDDAEQEEKITETAEDAETVKTAENVEKVVEVTNEYKEINTLNNSNKGVLTIAGITFAMVAVLAAILVIVFIILKKHKQRS